MTTAEKTRESVKQLEKSDDRLRVIMTRNPQADELTPEDGPQATG